MPQNEFEDWFENRIMFLVERTKLDKDRQTIEYKKRSLYAAAHRVSEGALDTLKTCWECNASGDLQKCTRCGVALYCCKECQVEAWKSGHKTKCSILGEKHAALMESLDTIDEAHQAGIIVHGIRLNAKADYDVATFIVRCGCTPVFDESFEDPPKGPTMKIFYNNLGRVAQGDFWFSQDAESLEVYKSKLRPGSEDDEYGQFLYLSFLLCFDYFAYCETFGATDAATVYATFSPILQYAVCAATRKWGMPMPAERFVELYKTWKEFDDLSRKRTRRNGKHFLLKRFRELYHK